MATKKAKVEQFDAVKAELDLLQLYMHDTQSGAVPIVVSKGNLRANLHRATNASGGYIVMRERTGSLTDYSYNTWIQGFDDAYRAMELGSFTAANEDYRTIIERCRIERQRVLTEREAEAVDQLVRNCHVNEVDDGPRGA